MHCCGPALQCKHPPAHRINTPPTLQRLGVGREGAQRAVAGGGQDERSAIEEQGPRGASIQRHALGIHRHHERPVVWPEQWQAVRPLGHSCRLAAGATHDAAICGEGCMCVCVWVGGGERKGGLCGWMHMPSWGCAGMGPAGAAGWQQVRPACALRLATGARGLRIEAGNRRRRQGLATYLGGPPAAGRRRPLPAPRAAHRGPPGMTHGQRWAESDTRPHHQSNQRLTIHMTAANAATPGCAPSQAPKSKQASKQWQMAAAQPTHNQSPAVRPARPAPTPWARQPAPPAASHRPQAPRACPCRCRPAAAAGRQSPAAACRRARAQARQTGARA